MLRIDRSFRSRPIFPFLPLPQFRIPRAPSTLTTYLTDPPPTLVYLSGTSRTADLFLPHAHLRFDLPPTATCQCSSS